ncbi:MAG: hypothetical protein QM687_12950 [Ferruginibacter sp.]
MKFLIVTLFTVITVGAIAQKPEPAFGEEKRIIKKGFCYKPGKKCLQQTSDYIIACKKLGDYYFTEKQYQKAIEFYDLVNEINLDGHGEVYVDQLEGTTLTAYKSILEKLGSIYFEGLGVEKNKATAAYYYNKQPSPLTEEELEKFSFKIFEEVFYYKKLDSLSNDSTTSFLINPFFLTDTRKMGAVNSIIKQIDASVSSDSSAIATFLIYPIRTSELEFGNFNRLFDNLMEENIANKARWDVDPFGSSVVQYKEVPCYVLGIKLSAK